MWACLLLGGRIGRKVDKVKLHRGRMDQRAFASDVGAGNLNQPGFAKTHLLQAGQTRYSGLAGTDAVKATAHLPLPAHQETP